MRLNLTVGTATIAAAAALALSPPTAAAQERAPRAEERETRVDAERRATELLRDLSRGAETIVRSYQFAAAAPDRATLGVIVSPAGARGVRVDSVTPGSPAERAGIRAGDHLTRIGDVPLRLDEADADEPVLREAGVRRLTRTLDDVDAGATVTLRVAGENGAERTVQVSTVRADSLQPARRPSAVTTWGASGDRATLGLSVSATGTVRDTLGAFVASVVPDGPAERAGVHEGHRIAAVNGVDLRVNPADVEDAAVAAAKAARLERTLRDASAGDEVTLRVWDGARYRDVRVKSSKASEVYDARTLFGQRLMPGMPGNVLEFTRPGTSIYRMAPGTPAAPRALTVPRGQVRVISPSRARRVIMN